MTAIGRCCDPAASLTGGINAVKVSVARQWPAALNYAFDGAS